MYWLWHASQMILYEDLMNDNLLLAKTTILEPANLTEAKLAQAVSGIITTSIDYADLYFQYANSESWALEDGIIKHGSYAVEQGVGVRAIAGDKVGFAYSNDLEFSALTQAAAAAKGIAYFGQTEAVVGSDVAAGSSRASAGNRGNAYSKPSGNYADVNSDHKGRSTALYSAIDPIKTISVAEKIDLLRKLDKHARSLDQRVIQVFASLAGSHEVVLIYASDGTFVADVRPLVRLNVRVVVEQHGRRENGSHGGGSRAGYAMFLTSNLAFSYAEEAVRQALVNLEAVAAPAGTMPVVLGSGWPGVLLHEAIGHGLEGDFNRKKSSAFTDSMGMQVASPLCTIVDDGTLPGRRGSLQVDDEGTTTSCTTLIENGVLKGYMQDKLNAKLMGCISTGNGRRESYACAPMPRMTNTYMLPGKHDPQEIIASVSKGLYAVNFGGGQVDITSGKFVFDASEAYLIENGKITRPVKGATLIGNGPDILTKVSMVGNDLNLDPGIGVCGKDGQSVPVGVGQPTLLITEMTVGGTAS